MTVVSLAVKSLSSANNLVIVLPYFTMEISKSSQSYLRAFFMSKIGTSIA